MYWKGRPCGAAFPLNRESILIFRATNAGENAGDDVGKRHVTGRYFPTLGNNVHPVTGLSSDALSQLQILTNFIQTAPVGS
ncbi:hypothetical protein [Leisingera sp. S232]|uniref:hypothetical protein n=1 Tax=Leisingera sp. S232 TaxID=3415132 RepID=UPI003C7B63DB